MLKKFIDKNGNWSMLETNVEPNRMARVEEIGGVLYERTIVETKKETVEVKNVEIVEEKEEEKVEEVETEKVEDFDYEGAKLFLKEKKVRGYGLLKGEKLMQKAKELGFNL